MKTLTGKIAVVTGARRGVGRGIARGLGEAGATVYVTGRTEAEGQGPGGLAGTIHGTAAEVSAGSGRGIAVRCDHRDDARTEAMFAQVRREQGRLDILVNNVWGGYEHFADGTEFWREAGFWDAPLSRWDSMFAAGVRAYYVSSDRMAALMAHDLRPHGIAAVSLYPGLVRTEGLLRAAEHFDLTNSESPQFLGRAVAALAADPQIMDKAGRRLVAAKLAEEYGFTDVDGKRPASCRAEMLGGDAGRNLGKGLQKAVQDASGLADREGGDADTSGMHDRVAELARVMHVITDAVRDGKQSGGAVDPVVRLARDAPAWVSRTSRRMPSNSTNKRTM